MSAFFISGNARHNKNTNIFNAIIMHKLYTIHRNTFPIRPGTRLQDAIRTLY